jgi:hypothetical protein
LSSTYMRARSFNGFLTQDHMMSMKETKTMFVRRERERGVLTYSFFLLIATLWIVFDE